MQQANRKDHREARNVCFNFHDTSRGAFHELKRSLAEGATLGVAGTEGRANAIQKGTRVLISLWVSLMFGRVPQNGFEAGRAAASVATYTYIFTRPARIDFGRIPAPLFLLPYTPQAALLKVLLPPRKSDPGLTCGILKE